MMQSTTWRILHHVTTSAQPCPCGGPSLASCCGPLLANRVQASSPEQLMRSRYSAFATGDADHLFRTWHPRTRPDDADVDPAMRWTGLRVLAAEDEVVEFEASYDGPAGPGVLRERSRFEQRGGRWVYVGAE